MSRERTPAYAYTGLLNIDGPRRPHCRYFEVGRCQRPSRWKISTSMTGCRRATTPRARLGVGTVRDGHTLSQRSQTPGVCADASASCLWFYLSEKKLCRFVSTSTKGKDDIVKKRTFQRACILSMPEEKAAARPKYKDLYIHPRSLILRIDSKADGICPGCPQRP